MFIYETCAFRIIDLLRDPATVPYSSKAFDHMKNIKETGKEQATHGTWSDCDVEITNGKTGSVNSPPFYSQSQLVPWH